MDAIERLAAFWRRPQEDLPKVARWGRLSGRLKQNTLQHTHGLQLLAIATEPHLTAAGHIVDMGVVLSVCVVHDHGEMQTGDRPAPSKKNEHDIEEYLAFCDQIAGLPEVVQQKKRWLFLVQFAGKSDEEREEFPEDAQMMMLSIRQSHPDEVRFFRMLEIFDYLMHAFAGYFLLKCPVVIDEILHGYIPDMRRFAAEIPGLDQVWTPEVDTWCDTYVRKAAA